MSKKTKLIIKTIIVFIFLLFLSLIPINGMPVGLWFVLGLIGSLGGTFGYGNYFLTQIVVIISVLIYIFILFYISYLLSSYQDVDSLYKKDKKDN